MPRYVVKGWWEDEPDEQPRSMTVHESDRLEETGLVDARGRPLYRVRGAPCGYIWKVEG